MKIHQLVIGSIFLAASLLRAEETPEAMAIRHFDAFKNNDMIEVANCMYEPDMVKMKQNLLPAVEKTFATDPGGISRDAAAMRLFLGNDDIEVLRAEPPRDFFIRFMNWVVRVNPMALKMVAGGTIQPLGHIMEGDTAHVVCRVNLEVLSMQVSQMKVVSVKKDGDEWRVLLGGDIEGLARMMQVDPRRQP